MGKQRVDGLRRLAEQDPQGVLLLLHLRRILGNRGLGLGEHVLGLEDVELGSRAALEAALWRFAAPPSA